MINPAYKITIGHKVVDTTDKPQASTVVGLNVAIDMETPADSLTLELGNVDGLKPKRDDETKVELGYSDNGGLVQVLQGAVDAVEPNLTTTRVITLTPAAKLLRSFTEITFESKTAGAIIRDLAKKASVDVATADDGISFPAYVIDGRRSFYRHMRDLADLCGFDLYFNSDGKVVFEQFTTGKTVHIFEYAKHIVELEVDRSAPLAGQVLGFGESPGAGKGQEAWAWLTKDFSGLKGSAGSGAPTLLQEKPALRSAEAASTAATAALTEIQRRTLRGRLLTIGRPQVKLGDALKLQHVPDGSLNGTYQVRGVSHRITKIGGFTTAVEFRSISA